MQTHVAAFDAAQVLISGYALARGGAPERVVTVALAVAATVNMALPFHPGQSFHYVEWGELADDVGLLLALAPVLLFANRYWPMWMTAVQIDAIAVHGVRAYDASLRAPIYEIVAGWAGYIILLVLAVGTYRHHAREVKNGSREAGWTTR